MKKILFVDDEIQILKSLVRLFMDTEYEIEVAVSGEDALKMLEKKDFHLVVSDMRMPNMDGYELLTKVKERYPQVVRVILSGYSEEKIVMKALQKNIAKMYMFKPWDNGKLLQTIHQILETKDVLRQKSLLNLINNIENLPTIKSSYQRILDLIRDDADMNEISSEIEKDASITTKLLHVANSAYFRANANSVKKAISFIGLNNTKNLVLSTSIFDFLNDSNASNESAKRLWKQAFLSNRLLNFLYENHLNKKLPTSFSLAGLLMDIGKFFLMNYFPEKYLEILSHVRNSDESLKAIEKQFFGVTHCEAGGYLLEWWEFPYPIIEAALYHHTPMDEKVINRELVCAAHVAAKYAMELLEEQWTGDFDERAFEFLGLSQSDFRESLVTFTV